MTARRETRAPWALGLAALVIGAGCAGGDATRAPSAVAEGRITGNVVDLLTGTPIEGARVRVEGFEATVRTDASGRFEIAAPAGTHRLLVANDAHHAITRLGVVVRASETRDERFELFARAPDEADVEALMIARGHEQTQLRDTPDDPALRPEAAAFLRGEADESIFFDDRATTDEGEVGAVRAALEAPPATVRIWRRSIDGAADSCSGRIDVLPLEDYIKGVLPHEWIPSWHAESLAAGSLAIRTYVWNWVLRGGKYDCADLDDTTRSQVYRDDRLEVGNVAVDSTTGQAIVSGGSLVSGEYSAENGDPTAYGVADATCTGRELFGHGRGMCQWGSQRWALRGQTHDWIATHYYPGASVEGGGGPPRPELAAELVAVDHPSEMVSGDRATVYIELKNLGARTWDLETTRIGTTQPQDHASPFYDAENWINDHRASGPDHSTYGPDVVGRFTFMITAPDVTEPTLVRDTFGLVQEGEAWFGPEDITIEVMVLPRASGGTTGVPPVMGGADAGTTPPVVEAEGSAMLTAGCSASGGGRETGALAAVVLLAIVAAGARRRAR